MSDHGKPLEKWQHVCKDCGDKQCYECEREIEYLTQHVEQLEALLHEHMDMPDNIRMRDYEDLRKRTRAVINT